MKRHDQEQMRILYHQWKESGESQTDFAKGKGIRPATFYYWTSKLRKEGSKPKEDKQSGFHSITIDEPPIENHGQATAIIHYPSGARLEIHTPLEAQFLKTLVD